MNGRFRVRPASGPEFQVDSLETLEEHVRSGGIGPGDEIFDALTGEWAPAAAHPVYRLVTDPLVADEADEEQDAPASDEPSPTSEDDDLAFDIVEHESPSPEEEAQAFLERMEAEREGDPDRAIVHEEGSRGWAAPAPELPPAAQPVGSRSAPESSPPEPGSEDAPVWAPLTTLSAHGAGPRRSLRQWFMGAAGLAAIALVLVGTTSVALPGLRDSSDEASPGSLAVGEEPPARVEPPSEGILGQQVFGDFLAEVDAIRRERRLGPPPQSWLGGAYLSGPSDHPEVREYWSRYLGFVNVVRREEDRLYRDAYLEALDRTRMRGAVRTLRLASGLAAFQDGRQRRARAYRDVSELAEAALALHRFLEEHEGSIRYEPARGRRLSADPVIEATASDAELQRALDAAIDRVLAALHGPEGAAIPSEPDDIPVRLQERLEDLEETERPPD